MLEYSLKTNLPYKIIVTFGYVVEISNVVIAMAIDVPFSEMH